ncbi:hypothetical protein BDC45DRAFT_525337 [Circinella umbellata]|nr:hypothetical protein BDC45DRAFT_525337 [Circinella umbellata]
MTKTRRSSRKIIRSNTFTTPRPILPKSILSPATTQIQSVSIIKRSNHICIQVYPSKVLVTIKELVRMAKEKRDHAIGLHGESIKNTEALLQATNMCLDKISSDYSGRQQHQAGSSKKRVLNSFMLFRSTHCKTLRQWLPDISNNEISAFLGEAWNAASQDLKDKYTEAALRINQQQMLNNHNNEHFDLSLFDTLPLLSAYNEDQAPSDITCPVPEFNITNPSLSTAPDLEQILQITNDPAYLEVIFQQFWEPMMNEISSYHSSENPIEDVLQRSTQPAIPLSNSNIPISYVYENQNTQASFHNGNLQKFF